MVVIWKESAKTKLEFIFENIAIKTSSKELASDVAERIYKSSEMLEIFPEMGRKGKHQETRELIIQGLPFFLVYFIEGNNLFILSVCHEKEGV